MQRHSGQPGGNRMVQIKEGLDSTVAKILEGAGTLYEAPPQPEPQKVAAAPRRISRMSFTYGIEKPKEKPGRRQSLLEDSSDEDDGKRKEEEEEALRHWTLEVADESIQNLISSIRCDERLDALEDLNESCSRNAASSQQLNSDMDELETQLCKEWQEMDQSISNFLEELEDKERRSYDALRGYFQCIEQQTHRKKIRKSGSPATGRGNRLQSRQAELRSGRVDPETRPSEILDVVHQMHQEMQKHKETLDMESKRQDAYAHALHKMQRAILFDEDPTRDQVTSQVLKEVRRWGLDAATEWEPESDEYETLSKTEYAMKVARVKTEIEGLKKRLERYNAKKEEGPRRTSRRHSLADVVKEEGKGAWRARLNDQNLSLFNEVVERRYQEDLRELTKAQRNLEGFLRRFEDLNSMVEHIVPELDDSRMKICEVTLRARPKLWQIERLPVLPSPEEQRIANFAFIRRVHDEEDQKEHKEKLKEMQTEKEAIERQANEQERRKTQLKQAIRQEQHLHDSLAAEIEDANGMMEGLDDNVNVVLAKDYMTKVEELKKTNAEKGFQLFEQVKDAESAEALQWKVAMTFDEVKVLTKMVLKDRADELLSSSESEASLASEPKMEQQISQMMGQLNFSRAGSKVQGADSATPQRTPSSKSFGFQDQSGQSARRASASSSSRPGFVRPARRSSVALATLGQSDQSPAARRQSLALGATGSESPRPASSVSGTSFMPSGSLIPSGSLKPSGSLAPSGSLIPSASLKPSGSLAPSSSLRDKEQEVWTKARRQTMLKGAGVLAALLAKAEQTADEVQTEDPPTSGKAPLQLPIGARRRKTVTRSDHAFAEIVAKAKAVAGSQREDSPGSPKPSASMPRMPRRASALATSCPDRSASKTTSLVGTGSDESRRSKGAD
eukprot:s1541_g16.t1